ncbi:Patatin family protein [Rhodovastum atsumiense]|uniref:Patatin family protein n=1 Tax=Rhodovastum atsumiense TaxID=504468 RepID=A0A5M6ILA9_9PROT|nr:patatin-like phospholipase family protein [Rhodovastum atsumiense]KAA5608348.1 patatin family protein [Rhodovastum atsumiense]CAH2602338.1 Patatin family protein [Rhodovastum atsumiense]
MARWLAAMLLLVLPAACALTRVPAPPGPDTEAIAVLGLPNARFWVDRSPEGLLQEVIRLSEREAATTPPGPDGRRPTTSFLAISGGGDDGAFGAGLLVGWSAAGTRPQFQVVTGISTGALTAPFAFLGPDYDTQLREVYTGSARRDIVLLRWLGSALLFGEALADTAPLYRLISRYTNEDMLAAIAREYAKGRLLLIGTTNLDLQRPVLWNIGAIAASGHPEALALFRSILLASASIPGAFPPVMIDVESSGRQYQEMHVDGGATAQVFLYPPSLQLGRRLRDRGIQRERIAYVIRNARMDPEWASTERRLMRIAARSISTMIHFSGLNDVVRIYQTTRRDHIGFRLAYIDADFQMEHRQSFEPAYMRALFEYGYEKARNGYPWRLRPPGFAQEGQASRPDPVR